MKPLSPPPQPPKKLKNKKRNKVRFNKEVKLQSLKVFKMAAGASYRG
jgi:hypothetical protein